MRLPACLLLLPALLAACGADPLPAPPRPDGADSPRRAAADPLPPFPESSAPAPPAAGPEGRPESAALRELEEAVREEPDAESELTKRDLEATQVSVYFAGTPIREFAAELARQTSHPVVVVDRTFQERTGEELAVELAATALSAAAALDKACETIKLKWWVEGRAVKIGPAPPPPPLIEIRIPLEDLSGDFGGDHLVELARDSVDPEVWDHGGAVSYDHGKRAIVVRAPKTTCRKVIAFLRGLRAPR